MNAIEGVFIAGAFRSPAGRLMGALSSLSAPQLASQVIMGALKRTGIGAKDIDEVILGNAVSAGIGQNPARQAALYAGLPDSIAAFTVNKVCASGMKAVSLGVEAILLEEADVVITGGAESMSNAPFLLKDMRERRHGDSVVVDSMVHDGLMDCYYGEHMGGLCELTARRYRLTRRALDSFALSSHAKAAEAERKGYFRDEMIPIRTSRDNGRALIDKDETIRRDTSLEKLSRLKPAFKAGGRITAGNSPGLNDGASVVVLVSGRALKRLGLKPLASIIGFASAHVDPKWYTIAPIGSVNKLLKKTGLGIGDFGLIEENEAFAAQTLAVIKGLRLDPARVNVNGGAIALGHPIGASGARIIATLVHALRARKKSLGLATICLGGGGAMSMAIRASDRP